MSHDSSAVVPCAKLCPDSSIIFHLSLNRATYRKFWIKSSSTLLCEVGPGLGLLSSCHSWSWSILISVIYVSANSFVGQIQKILFRHSDIKRVSYLWWICVSSGNGMLPHGTKPLSELMLTYCYVINEVLWQFGKQNFWITCLKTGFPFCSI